MYQNYCPCYLHLYMACFLTNCLQNARDAASANPFFSKFSGENTPRLPFGLAAAAPRYFAPEALIHPPPPPAKILATGLTTLIGLKEERRHEIRPYHNKMGPKWQCVWNTFVTYCISYLVLKSVWKQLNFQLKASSVGSTRWSFFRHFLMVSNVINDQSKQPC